MTLRNLFVKIDVSSLLLCSVTSAAPLKEKAAKESDFSFTVEPHSMAAGEKAILHWSIQGDTQVVIEDSPSSGGERMVVGIFGGKWQLTGAAQPKRYLRDHLQRVLNIRVRVRVDTWSGQVTIGTFAPAVADPGLCRTTLVFL